MMRAKLRILVAALCLVIAEMPAASAIEWNAVKQFSAEHNPNTYWSYATNALPLLMTKHACSIDKFSGWTTQQPIPNSMAVLRNKTGAEADCLTIRAPTDHLDMDPESGSITVSWKVPSTGKFLIKGDFLGIDTGQRAHPVSVSVNGGKTLFSATISTFGQLQTFRIVKALSAGEVINFTVSDGTDYHNLSTGLKVSIRPI